MEISLRKDTNVWSFGLIQLFPLL